MGRDNKLALLYDSAAEARSRDIGRLHDYWRAKLGGRRMAHPDDIDLYEIAPLRHGLIVAEYVGPRVRYDFVGSTHIHYNGGDFTGRFLDELGWDETDFIASVHDVLRRGVPAFGCFQWDYHDYLPGYCEFGFFPLSRDGDTVNGCVGFDDYSEFETLLDRIR
jgi:hypothetical protein